MTLKDIEALPRETISACEAAAVIGCNPQLLRIQARQDPQALGFPVICLPKRVKIPKAGFIAWFRGNAHLIREGAEEPCRETTRPA